MNIGFIGLGLMGKPMSNNILEGGHSLWVYTRTRPKAREILDKGAHWAENPKDVAEHCSMVLAALPGPSEVEEVFLGGNGILVGAKKGDIFIDLATNSPGVIRKMAAAAKEKGVHVLDAPVTGGPHGVREKTLTIMVGGDKEIFEKSIEVLKLLGNKLVYMGDTGAGDIAKLIHNMLGEVSIYAIAEGMALGAKAGLDLNKLYEVLSVGGPANRILTVLYTRRAFKGDFEPDATIDTAFKDQVLVAELGRDLGVPLYFNNLVIQRIVDARARGLGKKDITAAIIPMEDLLNIKIRIKTE